MIRPSDKKIIIATFGSNYANPITEHLEQKGFKNRNGEPFKAKSIRDIVNGTIENLKLEVAIINFTVKTKNAKSRIQKSLALKLRK